MRQHHIYLETKSAERTIKRVVDVLLKKKAAASIRRRKVIWFGYSEKIKGREKESEFKQNTFGHGLYRSLNRIIYGFEFYFN